MVKPLWAPWRLEYVQQADEATGCVFCSEAAGELPAAESLLLRRGDRTVAILNKFPYSSGHLLVAPVRHVGDFGELTDEEAVEIHQLAVATMRALDDVYAPERLQPGLEPGPGRRRRESRTTSTSTSFRAGAETRISCRSWRT